jgi:uncharacterized cofD-like protein
MSQTKKKIVVVGGGTGTYTILRGLRHYTDTLELTAIVTMADSGGSTGRLRDEFGQLPVGDVRMALAALATDVDSHAELVRELFLYRFDKGEGLSGHTFGNLLLTALSDIMGSHAAAIETTGKLLGTCGRVIPVTTDNVHLKAEYDDGVVVVGEHAIDVPEVTRAHRRIVSLSVTPAATITPAAATALKEADLIVFGPGDLYTSILAACVTDGFMEAVAASTATCVYVANLMSRLGQTTGMHVTDYVTELQRYLGRAPHHVLCNSTPFDTELLVRYEAEGNHQVAVETNNTNETTFHYLDLLASEAIVRVSGDTVPRSLIRHDSEKLAAAVVALVT